MLPLQRMTAFTNSPNPAGCPAGPEGEIPFSERDLVVSVDQFGGLKLGRFRAAQEVNLLGDDLAAVAVIACRVGPFRVVDAAMDEDLHALFVSRSWQLRSEYRSPRYTTRISDLPVVK
jgi:hypothetical protein